MLSRTRPHLSPAELDLTPEHHRALVLTLEYMRAGRIFHSPPVDIFGSDGNFTGHFNMRYWHRVADCGTVACIGGTAEMLGGVIFTDKARNNQDLYDLFHPFAVCAETSHHEFMRLSKTWERITVEQAALALENYLATGSAGWKEILA